VPDLKQYQDFLYNDEFVRVGTPHKSVTWAKTKSEAIKKAQELLKEFGKGARRKHAGRRSSRGYEKRVRQGHY
jgi:predicted ABC-type transport system involved in lysophospholipase L1 biosynthesis ATPase subunit